MLIVASHHLRSERCRLEEFIHHQLRPPQQLQPLPLQRRDQQHQQQPHPFQGKSKNPFVLDYLHFFINFVFSSEKKPTSISLANKSMVSLLSQLRWRLSNAKCTMCQWVEQSSGWRSLLCRWKTCWSYKLCSTTMSKMAYRCMGPGK